jgi:hypothetical protein
MYRPELKGNAATGDVETGGPIANYDVPLAKAAGAAGIALTNYQAILGTHIDDIGPAVPPYPLKSASLPNSNNGAMLFRGIGFDIGRMLAAITDGTSKTPVVAETRERRLSSWYDGTFNWLVAARHSKPNDGTKAITAANKTTKGIINGLQVDNRWTVGTDCRSQSRSVSIMNSGCILVITLCFSLKTPASRGHRFRQCPALYPGFMRPGHSR